MVGVVIKVTGSWHEVRLADGSVIPCRIVGKLRMEDIKTTNPVGVGDFVEILPEDGDSSKGVITEIHSRRNYVVRQSPRKKTRPPPDSLKRRSGYTGDDDCATHVENGLYRSLPIDDRTA